MIHRECVRDESGAPLDSVSYDGAGTGSPSRPDRSSSTCSTVPHCITVRWSRLAAVALDVLVCPARAIGVESLIIRQLHVWLTSCWLLGTSRFAPLEDECQCPVSPIYNESTLILETMHFLLCIEKEISCSSSPAFHSGACCQRTIPEA